MQIKVHLLKSRVARFLIYNPINQEVFKKNSNLNYMFMLNEYFYVKTSFL